MDRIPSGNELLNPTKLVVKANIQARMTVADFGCGSSGVFALQAAKAVSDKGVVYAIDVMKSSLDSVISRGRMQGLNNIKTVWSNIEIYGATQVPSGSVERGLLINVLFQTKKHLEILKEVKRMLKPEAMLLVVDWKPHGAPFGPLDKDRVPAERVKNLANELNFKLLEEFEAGPFHYGLLLVNPA
ncbi:MAG: class I SAM-dependent methyltransferase [Patescibacteria group bacterium]|jgi:ubiquinone/menaquinone biosynthesis C-methylase UbiE